MGAVSRVRVREGRESVRRGVALSLSGVRMEMVEGEDAAGVIEMGKVAGVWLAESVGCVR